MNISVEKPIEKTEAWVIDGKPFLTQDEAKTYLFEKQLTAWFDANFAKGEGQRGPRPHFNVVERMIEDRYNLLKIFKVLNGGAVVLPPPRPKPEAPPHDVAL